MLRSMSAAADELAHRLQQQRQQESLGPEQKQQQEQMIRVLRSHCQQVLQYEDPVLQSQCRDLIPIAELEKRCSQQNRPECPLKELLILVILSLSQIDS